MESGEIIIGAAITEEDPKGSIRRVDTARMKEKTRGRVMALDKTSASDNDEFNGNTFFLGTPLVSKRVFILPSYAVDPVSPVNQDAIVAER